MQGKVPENIWVDGVAGTTRQATAELKAIFDGTAPFDTPKPTKLIERIIQIATDADSNCLDMMILVVIVLKFKDIQFYVD